MNKFALLRRVFDEPTGLIWSKQYIISGMIYTDLIIEAAKDVSIPCKSYVQKGIAVDECNIDKVLSRKTGRREGKYITLSPTPEISEKSISGVIKNSFLKLLRYSGIHEGKLLIVGLGNENVIVDALGNEVTKHIDAGQKNGYYLATIAPKVQGLTGIMSFDIVKAIVENQSPDAVIAIDTLATNRLERLGKCYQLTTSGICPGGGAGNPQPCLDKQSLSVPVVSIGVPLIISVGAILGRHGKVAGYSHYMLTPRDVDSLVKSCASVIADAINGLKRQHV